jgi:hypothetical protein
MTSGRRRDAQFLLVFVAGGSAIAIVSWLSALQDWGRRGEGIDWWKPLVWESTSVVTVALLAPLVMALTRRVEPMERPWPSVLGVHAVAAVAFSLIHVTAMGALRAVIFALVGDSYSAFLPLKNFVYEFRKDMLVYAGIVGLYVLWRRMTPFANAPEALETIEVKDGARRRFVAAADILWIEAAGNYVELQTAGPAVLHRAPLSELERQLGGGFVRVHRSRLVRRDAVAQVESRPSGDYVIRLVDGREVAGSRRYRRPLLEP